MWAPLWKLLLPVLSRPGKYARQQQQQQQQQRYLQYGAMTSRRHVNTAQSLQRRLFVVERARASAR